MTTNTKHSSATLRGLFGILFLSLNSSCVFLGQFWAFWYTYI